MITKDKRVSSRFVKYLPLFVLLIIPATASADAFSSLSELVDTFTNTIIKSLATLFISVAVVIFFYGIVEFMWAKRQGDGGAAKDGGKFMQWGLIALFVMFSVYGIIKLSQSFFGMSGNTDTITIPKVEFKGGTGGQPNGS